MIFEIIFRANSIHEHLLNVAKHRFSMKNCEQIGVKITQNLRTINFISIFIFWKHKTEVDFNVF